MMIRTQKVLQGRFEPKIITKCNNFSQRGFDPKNYYRGIRTQKVLQWDSNPKSTTGKIRTHKVLQSVILFLKGNMSPKSITEDFEHKKYYRENSNPKSITKCNTFFQRKIRTACFILNAPPFGQISEK